MEKWTTTGVETAKMMDPELNKWSFSIYLDFILFDFDFRWRFSRIQDKNENR
ncbi:hypothetical protein [Ammoniphilus sp. 3BR4]|uniref:hypothetical protein n=1 Tax=Ammoniphilus sp. 3BR4 TaxID=3158265 RepID=UPI003465B35A